MARSGRPRDDLPPALPKIIIATHDIIRPMPLNTLIPAEAVPVEVDGHKLKCLMCHHETFHRRRSHVDTSLTSNMNPDWVDRQVYCLVCDHCKFIHWFLAA